MPKHAQVVRHHAYAHTHNGDMMYTDIERPSPRLICAYVVTFVLTLALCVLYRYAGG